jgi:hypothetical protein
VPREDRTAVPAGRAGQRAGHRVRRRHGRRPGPDDRPGPGRRAGAQAVSLATYRQDGDLVLNPAQAVADADAYLASIGAAGTATATDGLVTVTVTIVQPMQILSAAGLHAVTVHATASAVPVRGIDGPLP